MQITRAEDVMFKPTLNITEQIADHLASLVITGRLSSGARIQELKIAHELGVSRGSVREALLILERRHLIEIVPRKGAVVNCLEADEALELIDMLASVERRWFHSLMAQDTAEEALQEADEMLLVMERAAKAGSHEDITQARSDFYHALLSPASRYMNGVFECLLPTSQRLVYALLRRSDVELYDVARYCRALHSALVAKDGERLDELLTAFHKRLRQLSAKLFADHASSKNRFWARRDNKMSA